MPPAPAVVMCTLLAVTSSMHTIGNPGFRLAPAPVPALQVLNLVNTTEGLTTWGGSVVADGVGTGSHHLYASAFSGHCGLAAWETNSYVVHAVSTTGPAGPFAVADTAVPSFAHNPEVVYSAKERKYILFTLGHRNASAPLACTPDGRPVGTWGGRGAPPWLSDVSMFTADQPGGPWLPRLDAAGREAVIASGLNANPTAHVDADTGELTLVYGRFDRPHSPHSRIYSVVTAASTGAPWVPQGDLPASLTPPRNCSQDPTSSWYQCACINEDPHLWYEDGAWRLLFHQYTDSHDLNDKTRPCPALLDPAAGVDPSLAVVGGQAWSLTSNITGPWHYDYFDAAYGMQPEWGMVGMPGVPGMRPPALSRRERPKVLLERGKPVYLYNGASVDKVGAEGGNRNCFTFGTAILP